MLNLAELIKDHVTLSVDGVHRHYLNAVEEVEALRPGIGLRLERAGGIVGYVHRPRSGSVISVLRPSQSYTIDVRWPAASVTLVRWSATW